MSDEEISRQSGLQQLESTNPATILAATNFQLLPNSTAFNVHAPSPGIVCLTEGQGKTFTATVNGKLKEVLTVNRAFKGVYLSQPGDYHIEFIYRPHYWRLACVWFGITIVIIVVLCGWDFFSFKFREKNKIIGRDEKNSAP
ncbi:MAG TPA: hypothetical protein VN516_07515 [Candidatus Baltobacteraceae bacterium]|nr:hypothetical protein [Candidatus Baltobacteraceae bacterium]